MQETIDALSLCETSSGSTRAKGHKRRLCAKSGDAPILRMRAVDTGGCARKEPDPSLVHTALVPLQAPELDAVHGPGLQKGSPRRTAPRGSRARDVVREGRIQRSAVGRVAGRAVSIRSTGRAERSLPARRWLVPVLDVTWRWFSPGSTRDVVPPPAAR
jgi:hypothetical protein